MAHRVRQIVRSVDHLDILFAPNDSTTFLNLKPNGISTTYDLHLTSHISATYRQQRHDDQHRPQAELPTKWKSKSHVSNYITINKSTPHQSRLASPHGV